MALVSLTKNAVIEEVHYFLALERPKKYSLDSKEDSLLVKGLTLSELESLLG